MVYTSKLPSKVYPKDKTIYDILFQTDRNIPQDKLAYVDVENPEKCLTYGQLHTQILKATEGLQSLYNFQKGDVLAICSPNQIDYPVVLHAAVCAGGIASPIGYANSPETIAQKLDIVQPKILVTHIGTLDNTLAAAKIHGIPESQILVFGDVGKNGVKSVDETILSGDKLGTPYPYTPEEILKLPAYLYFTSGTTGTKKVVMITQGNMLAGLSWNPDSPLRKLVALSYTEFHHGSSLVSTMIGYLYFGINIYIMANYTMDSFCQAIEKFKINMITTQPHSISNLMKDEISSRYNLSSLKMIICGGTALDNYITRLVNEKFHIPILNVYAMTEILKIFTPDPFTTLKDSVGYLSADMTARIVDDEGNDVPTGEMGELWVRGPIVTPGYYRNPEATAATIDADGYLHTGDLVKCDEDGLFYYIDRAKDLIKYYYHNRICHICPSDIENLLINHPKVSDCAVIGVYYPELVTELPRAYVKLVEGEFCSEEIQQEILEYINNRLSDFEQLRGGLVIVDDFPRTASGKIRRRILRQNVKKITV